MKFQTQYTGKAVSIPPPAMALGGFEKGERLELHPLQGAVAVLWEKMTAMELVSAIDSLQSLASALAAHLVQVCGPCDRCGECSVDPENPGGGIAIPDWLRREAGIPEGAKLCAWLDSETGRVNVGAAEYRHDLSDVPPFLLGILRESGACLGNLDELLKSGETVYD